MPDPNARRSDLPFRDISLGHRVSDLVRQVYERTTVRQARLISVLFSVGAIHPLVMSQARAVVPADKLGIALGLLNTLVFLGIGLANACFGAVASEGRRAHLAMQQIYAALFAGTALMLAIGATAYVFSPRTAPPRSSAERE